MVALAAAAAIDVTTAFSIRTESACPVPEDRGRARESRELVKAQAAVPRASVIIDKTRTDHPSAPSPDTSPEADISEPKISRRPAHIVRRYPYVPHQHPIPCVLACPSTSSPSYGRWHIDNTRNDPQTGLEYYVLLESRARPEADPPKSLTIPVEDITRYVAASEIEAYELREHRNRSAIEEQVRLIELEEMASRLQVESSAHYNGAATDDERTGGHRGLKRTSKALDGDTKPTTKKRKFAGMGPGGHWKAKREAKMREEAMIRNASQAATSSKSKGKGKNGSRSATQSKASSVVPVTDDESEESWEVENLLADWFDETMGQRFYSVKWLGFDELTEEPESHLAGSWEIVQDYWDRKQADADEAAVNEALQTSMDAYANSDKGRTDVFTGLASGAALGVYLDHDTGKTSASVKDQRHMVLVPSASPSQGKRSSASEYPAESQDESQDIERRSTDEDVSMSDKNDLQGEERVDEEDASLAQPQLLNGAAMHPKIHDPGGMPDDQSVLDHVSEHEVNSDDDSSDDEEDETDAMNAHGARGALTAFVTGSEGKKRQAEAPSRAGGALKAFKAAFSLRR